MTVTGTFTARSGPAGAAIASTRPAPSCDRLTSTPLRARVRESLPSRTSMPNGAIRWLVVRIRPGVPVTIAA